MSSLLWRAFDRAERGVAPRLERAVRAGVVLDGLSAAIRCRAAARSALGAQADRAWRAMSVVSRRELVLLRKEVARMDRDLHRVSGALGRVLEETGVDQEAARVHEPARPGLVDA